MVVVVVVVSAEDNETGFPIAIPGEVTGWKGEEQISVKPPHGSGRRDGSRPDTEAEKGPPGGHPRHGAMLDVWTIPRLVKILREREGVDLRESSERSDGRTIRNYGAVY